MSIDLIPMLLLSLLLLTSGGNDVRTVEIVMSGEQHITEHRGALLVADAQVVVPASADLAGPIHIIGGTTRLDGTVDGDVTQVAGTLLVGDDARIAGTLQHIGGTLQVSPAAVVQSRTSLDVVTAGNRDGVQGSVLGAVLTALLAWVGARRARRRPAMLATAGHAVAGHPLVSLTVGALLTVTFLSLFVFMAFTLILLPVSVLGMAGGLVALGYGIIVLGHLAGRRMTSWRAGPATAAGIVGVMVALQLLGEIPLVGDLLVIVVLLAALGAVFLTYFGLREFRPVTLPD